MTNLEKFIEVFGFEPDRNMVLDDTLPIVISCAYRICERCPFWDTICKTRKFDDEDDEICDEDDEICEELNEIWWNSEYKGE